MLNYKHIRNATAKIHYAGVNFLIDPYLPPQWTYEGFAGTKNSHLRNPTIGLPETIESILEWIDAVIVTHLHDDHWDKFASEKISKNLPIFVQNAADANILRGQGFENVNVMGNHTEFKNVKLTRVKWGQHGTDQMYSIPALAELAGDAMWVIFESENEKTLHVVWDTIYNDSVENILKKYNCDVIVLNTGYAQLEGFEWSLIMWYDDVKKISEMLLESKIITVHMDATNHNMITKEEMKNFVSENNLKNVLVPEEGEILTF